MDAAGRFAVRFVWFVCALFIAFDYVAAGPFNSVVIFGDSLSDIGNIAQAPIINEPGPYYWNGRFSNGPVYAESFTTGLGLPTLVAARPPAAPTSLTAAQKQLEPASPITSSFRISTTKSVNIYRPARQMRPRCTWSRLGQTICSRV